MEEQASNNNLHNNESPISEFIDSVGNLIGKVEYNQPYRFPRTQIDFNLIEQSYELIVRYESNVTLGDVLDCGEDPNEVDPWTIEPSDLDESDREVDGSAEWYSRHYVEKDYYNQLADNYNTLWNHFIELRNFYDILIKPIKRAEKQQGGEA